MAQLDRMRDFGQIWGSGEDDGALYTQDGLRFMADGTEAIRQLELIPPTTVGSETGNLQVADKATAIKKSKMLPVVETASDDLI